MENKKTGDTGVAGIDAMSSVSEKDLDCEAVYEAFMIKNMPLERVLRMYSVQFSEFIEYISRNTEKDLLQNLRNQLEENNAPSRVKSQSIPIHKFLSRLRKLIKTVVSKKAEDLKANFSSKIEGISDDVREKILKLLDDNTRNQDHVSLSNEEKIENLEKSSSENWTSKQ